MARVTIAVPCFNEAGYIEATLKSLLQQSEENLEIIVCDNASTDGTEEIVRELAEEDVRIQIERNEANIGGRLNFIRAFDCGSSPYFMWSGAHDLYGTDYIKQLCNMLDADSSAVLAFSDSVFVSQQGEELEGEDVNPGFDLTESDPIARLGKLLWALQRCDMLHGVMRKEKVDCRPMVTAPEFPDMAFLPSLALSGRIVRYPKVLFFRRLSRGMQSPDDHQKHLVDDGYVEDSTNHEESWMRVRDAVIASIHRSDCSANEKKRGERIANFCFLKRFGVPWSPGSAATFTDKWKCGFGTGDKDRRRLDRRMERRLVEEVLELNVRDKDVVERMTRRLAKLTD